MAEIKKVGDAKDYVREMFGAIHNGVENMEQCANQYAEDNSAESIEGITRCAAFLVSSCLAFASSVGCNMDVLNDQANKYLHAMTAEEV